MRTILAIVMAIAVIFVGAYALSYQAQGVQDVAVDNGTQATADAYNLTTDVTEGLVQVYSPALVFMGIAVIVLVALAYLVVAGRSGR